MPFHNRPLVPIAVSYICGIVFAKYFYIPWFVSAFIVFSVIFVKRPPYKIIFFYSSIFIIGYLFYQLSLYYNFSPSCGFLKENIRKIIYFNMPIGEERNFLTGLLLGERRVISQELINVLRNTNTMHILAISGDHIGFVGIMLFAIFRLLFVPRKTSALLALIIVFFYVSVVGWQAPSFRAVIMFGALAVGWTIDRPSDIINSLALAALIILLVTPQALFQAGFQLSFVIVFCLLVGVTETKGSQIKKALMGSCVAWIGSLPLVAYYFKIISPISILANLVIVPAISIVIALGFAGILLGNIYLPIGGVFNATNYFLTKILIKFLEFMSSIPLGYFSIQDFPVYLVLLSYLIIGLVFFLLSQRKDSVIE